MRARGRGGGRGGGTGNLPELLRRAKEAGVDTADADVSGLGLARVVTGRGPGPGKGGRGKSRGGLKTAPARPGAKPSSPLLSASTNMSSERPRPKMRPEEHMQGLPGDLSRSLIGNRLAFLGRGYYAPQLLPAALPKTKLDREFAKDMVQPNDPSILPPSMMRSPSSAGRGGGRGGSDDGATDEGGEGEDEGEAGGNNWNKLQWAVRHNWGEKGKKEEGKHWKESIAGIVKKAAQVARGESGGGMDGKGEWGEERGEQGEGGNGGGDGGGGRERRRGGLMGQPMGQRQEAAEHHGGIKAPGRWGQPEELDASVRSHMQQMRARQLREIEDLLDMEKKAEIERQGIQLAERHPEAKARRERRYNMDREESRKHILNIMRDSELALVARLANLGVIR